MPSLKLLLEQFSQDFFKELQQITHEHELESFRITYLGRNGKLADLMAKLKELSVEEKRIFGPELNKLKEDTQRAYENKKHNFELLQQQIEVNQKKNFDVTAYTVRPHGSLHPYTRITEEIEDIFMSMGFAIVDGPEVETPFYNFEALNIPADHPARDMHDTFWLTLPDSM